MAEKKLKPYEIGELDHYLFGQGNHYEIYKKLGAHPTEYNGEQGVYFAVWEKDGRIFCSLGSACTFGFRGWRVQ